MKNYDVIIIGAGPAGLSSALYCSRYHLKTLILEKDEVGGRANQIKKLVTYPGVPNTTGTALTQKMLDHAKSFGAQIAMKKPRSLKIEGDKKVIHTRKQDYSAKAIILATGMVPKKFNVPGEEEFSSMGISYCATCDAEFYKDQIVYVVGNSDQAISEALMTCQYAKEVNVVVNDDRLRCNSSTEKEAKAEPKMHFIWNAKLVSINGDMNVTSITIQHNENKKEEKLRCDGNVIKLRH